jgi:catechol 2,3-dioxygenase-like lactoylglutathione lyase family enzyme
VWAPDAPVGQAPYFHVGILVADLEAAIERFSRVLGVRFGPVSDTQTPVQGETNTVERIRATYSVDGPPFFELIEGSGNGLFSLQNGEGLHHLGIWWPSDFEKYNERTVGKELSSQQRICTVSAAPSIWLTAPERLHGVRLEFLDPSMRDQISQLLSPGD